MKKLYMKNLLTLVLFTAVFATMSFAHGGAKHVMGTVKAMNSDSLTVTGQDNKPQVIYVTGQTKFEKAGQPAALKDLKPRDRVVVEVREVNGKLEAESVRFGKSAAPMKMPYDMSKMKSGMSQMSH